MSVVIILVFVAIVMAGGFLVAFIWSVKNGQYEDTYTPSVRILFDDPPMKENNEPAQSAKKEKKKTNKRKRNSKQLQEEEDSKSESNKL